MNKIFDFKNYFYNLLVNNKVPKEIADYLDNLIIFVIIIFIALIVNFVGKKIILSIVARYVRKSKNEIDDVFLEKKVFNRLSQLLPSIVIFYSISSAFDDVTSKWIDVIKIITEIYMVIVIMLITISFLKAINVIHEKLSKNKSITIKSYIQIGNIFVIITSVLIIFSIIFDVNLSAIFTGLGAFTAILMLIFQDTIKGLVGGIILSTHEMVQINDWISMPKFNADGIVIDVSLNIVKVQNWDKSISTIPTYSMVTDSFSNWKGMEEADGRRIKRSIIIDVKSIKFLTADDITKYKKIKHLTKYIEQKEIELNKKNTELGVTEDANINGKSLTNIGTFRIYLENYLVNNENINKDMTFIVRQLPSTESGLPIEIYVFSKEKDWNKYEQIQADIFDHVLAIVPVFELRVFQNPTGEDFRNFIGK